MILVVFHSPPFSHALIIVVLLVLFGSIPALIVALIVYYINRHRSRKGITRLV